MGGGDTGAGPPRAGCRSPSPRRSGAEPGGGIAGAVIDSTSSTRAGARAAPRASGTTSRVADRATKSGARSQLARSSKEPARLQGRRRASVPFRRDLLASRVRATIAIESATTKRSQATALISTRGPSRVLGVGPDANSWCTSAPARDGSSPVRRPEARPASPERTSATGARRSPSARRGPRALPTDLASPTPPAGRADEHRRAAGRGADRGGVDRGADRGGVDDKGRARRARCPRCPAREESPRSTGRAWHRPYRPTYRRDPTDRRAISSTPRARDSSAASGRERESATRRATPRLVHRAPATLAPIG